MNVPTLSRAQCTTFLKNTYPQLDPSKEVLVVGLRGYFDPGHNQRGIYDDAIAIITPTEYMIVNGNCDPSVTQPGIAVAQDGIYWYRKGLHDVHRLNANLPADRAILIKLDDIASFQKTWVDLVVPGRSIPYWALRQDSDVTVLRDGSKIPYTDTPPRPRMWIDIHVGGYNVTSSAGCQTIYPTRWPAFRKLIFTEMDLHKQPRIQYALATLKVGIESKT